MWEKTSFLVMLLVLSKHHISSVLGTSLGMDYPLVLRQLQHTRSRLLVNLGMIVDVSIRSEKISCLFGISEIMLD